jgi:hypothetical protein
VSDESTSQSKGGQSANLSSQAPFTKKKAKKDGVGSLFMAIAVLGIIACLASIAFSVMFTANG